LDALRTLPGVSGVQGEHQLPVLLRHRSRDASLQARGADGGTLEERKLKVDRGRFFNAIELAEGAQVVVLDEQSSKALFKDTESPIGKTVLLSGMGGSGGGMGGSGGGGMGAAAQALPPNAPLPFTVIGTVKAD
jgi:macrolide transport system ATP-binding/permease protein